MTYTVCYEEDDKTRYVEFEEKPNKECLKTFHKIIWIKSEEEIKKIKEEIRKKHAKI